LRFLLALGLGGYGLAINGVYGFRTHVYLSL
jgi:hypothetical protein